MSTKAIDLKRLGNRSLAGRDYASARQAFADLISLEPDSYDGYIGMARVLDSIGDFRGVVDLLQPVAVRLQSGRLTKLLADAQRVLVNRGDAVWLEPAIENYRKYLAERRDPVALYYLAELLREHRRDYGEALRLLKESWELDPGSRALYQSAIDCAKRLGRLDELTAIKTQWHPR